MRQSLELENAIEEQRAKLEEGSSRSVSLSSDASEADSSDERSLSEAAVPLSTVDSICSLCVSWFIFSSSL